MNMEKAPTNNHRKPEFPEGVKTPEGLSIGYVSLDNKFMREAATYAAENAFEGMTVTSTVLVKDGKIISKGINGDGYHQKNNRCEREGMPSGKGYELCPGCHPDNHSERVAIKKAQELGVDLSDAEAYLYGHWWSCESCMNALSEAGVKNLYLLEGGKQFFAREIEGSTQKRAELEKKILSEEL